MIRIFKYTKTICLIIVLVFSPVILFASGDSSSIQAATSSLLITAQYVIGALVIINMCFTAWALVNGDSKSKNLVIGTVVGMLVWIIVYAIVEAGNVGI